MSTTPSLVGQVISGCEILEKTAEGGMGAVYRARHRALNRIVCVKILSPALSTDKKAVELFLTEARAIAELDHPNIVNVYNVGKEHGYYFIVMSFVEGQTLSAMLKKEKVLPVNRVLDLFDGVLQGLEAAHAKGIIHRDIKPSNILINPQGQAKVVDFGIAKKVNKTGTTKTSELAGTAYFIAPEQALGYNLDTRADLYSIGASLYYVLTGQFPYNGKNTIEIIQKHINNPVPNPTELRKDLPAWLGPAIQKLMSKNPDDRFQTAKETYLYFRKMRAEDQLRLKSGSAGKAIDLGGESPKLVVKEELKTTQTLRTQRMLYGHTTTSNTQPTVNSSLMPQLNEEMKQIKKSVKEPSRPQSVKPLAPTGLATNTQAAPGISSAFKRKLGSLILFLPLWAVFAAGIIYVFHALGAICSVYVSPAAGFIHNLLAPILSTAYVPQQMLFTGICIVVLALIFASSAIRAFAHSTTILLFLAVVSWLAGLFTPHVHFINIDQMAQFLFSPEYYLCYFVLALSWGISLCWTINRSLPQGLLASSLVIFSMGMAFASSSLSIPPNHQDIFFTVLFYASLFCGVCAIYYLVSRVNKDTILLPFLLMIAAVAGIWIYTVSGLVSSATNTLDVLISRVEVNRFSDVRSNNKNNNTDTSSNLQEVLEVTTPNAALKSIDNSNEFTNKPLEEVAEVLQGRIEKAAPNMLGEEMRAFFAHLLAPYYQGGKERLALGIWTFAMTFPIHNFNYNAQDNNAYFFLIALLYIFGLLSCAGTILMEEIV